MPTSWRIAVEQVEETMAVSFLDGLPIGSVNQARRIVPRPSWQAATISHVAVRLNGYAATSELRPAATK
jgi:hypothetical protein